MTTMKLVSPQLSTTTTTTTSTTSTVCRVRQVLLPSASPEIVLALLALLLRGFGLSFCGLHRTVSFLSEAWFWTGMYDNFGASHG